MKSPHTDSSPSQKTISTIITASAPQVCLPSNPRPTHPTPLWTSDPAAVSYLPCNPNPMMGNQLILILLITIITTTIAIIILNFYFLYLGFWRYSSLVVFEDPLYYMGWSESLLWTEKNHHWKLMLGRCFRALDHRCFTSGTEEVTEKCSDVSSWSSMHEESWRSLSKTNDYLK